MVRVSKKYLDKELKSKAWEYFLQAIKESKPDKMLAENLKKFLTPSEMTMLEKRLAILILLNKKMSYLDIRHLIDVSPGTVSFIKHNFTKKRRVYKKHVSNIIRKTKEEKEKILPFPSRSDHGRWLRRV